MRVTNYRLEREITRRKTAESGLKDSKRDQKVLLGRSEQMRGQMRDLTRRLLHAQEEERRRISRELHDEVLQTLVGINVHLENLRREVQLGRARLNPKILKAQRLVTSSVNSIHRFARELRPLILDDLGLLPAINSSISDFRKRTPTSIQFTSFAEVEQLSGARRTALYRVLQSALANVVKHARAKHVKISIRARQKIAVLKIHDDGCAFDVAATLNAKRYKRLGLLGMRERVEMVGGNFSIESSPGRGTTILAEFPLP